MVSQRSVQSDGRSFEKGCQLRSGLELGNRIEVLERARERIGKTPCRPRSEFLDDWIEVEVVDPTGEMLRDIQPALYESLVDDEFCAFVRKAGSLPDPHLLPHWLEVSLHSVHADGEDVYEV